MSAFDVILPTFNNLDELKVCLEGLATQTFDSFRLIICVDGSTDGTLEYLESWHPGRDVTVLTHPSGKNRGRNPTRNLALPDIQSEFLLMLDSDLKPDPFLLETHWALLKERDCISLGHVTYTNARQNHVADYIMSRGKNRFRQGEILPAHYLNTQNVAMRSDHFKAVGGQDATMVTYGGGDLEFGCRLVKERGVPLVLNRNALAYGVWDKTLTGILTQMEEFGAINLPYIQKKHPETRALFGMHLLYSSSAKARLIRWTLRAGVEKMVKCSLPLLPRFLRLNAFHYLFFYHIARGYRRSTI